MIRYIMVVLIIIVIACSEQSSDKIYTDPEFVTDTLIAICEDSIYIKINRKADMKNRVMTESFTDDGKFIMFYTENIVSILYMRNNKEILNKEFRKSDFEKVCGNKFLADKRLDKITFDKFNIEQNYPEFEVSIYKPDTDVGCDVLLKISEDGKFRIEDYKY